MKKMLAILCVFCCFVVAANAWAEIGTLTCDQCKKEIKKQTCDCTDYYVFGRRELGLSDSSSICLASYNWDTDCEFMDRHFCSQECAARWLAAKEGLKIEEPSKTVTTTAGTSTTVSITARSFKYQCPKAGCGHIQYESEYRDSLYCEKCCLHGTERRMNYLGEQDD